MITLLRRFFNVARHEWKHREGFFSFFMISALCFFLLLWCWFLMAIHIRTKKQIADWIYKESDILTYGEMPHNIGNELRL